MLRRGMSDQRGIDACHITCYRCVCAIEASGDLIESFRHKGLKRLFEDGKRKGVNAELSDRIENILGLLDAATTVQDMSLPSLRLQPLAGDLKGFWSVTVRANWRITFRFEDGRAIDVDLVDYH